MVDVAREAAAFRDSLRAYGLAADGLVRPALTVVAQGVVEIGRTTVDLFRARLADPSRPVRTGTVATTLIVRGSGKR
jgi:DNA-binding LacI/PurR family transcriptional regulator